ncbi:TPA: Gfo/Idh/MocA family oxidoreductase [Candidatus Poribacteria bacterium]|nr:Gfo/Idh/MocA family oxidoreductase [Candidatus Poribacteria bacterium]
MDKLKIALVGAGNRASGAYAPTIATLDDDLEFVAVCDVVAEKAEALAQKYNVPAFTDVVEMVEKTKPDIAAVVITPSRNHEAGIPLSEHGVSYCTETPIDTDLGWADKMIATAKENNTKLEVCENYYRVPGERIKRALILEGVFGKILTAYNDFNGHGYHGVGLIRSYIGFDVEAVRVIGMTKNFTVQEHLFRRGQPVRSDENWQHGLIEFENGSVGVFNFSSLSYGSPLRWYNTSKFYGERGMCVGDGQRGWTGNEKIAILNDEADARLPIVVERRTTQAKDGTEVLDALIARTDPDTGLEVVWKNPLSHYPLSDGQLSVASEIMSIANAVRNDTEPEYGAENGRKDREIDLAIFQSARNNNQPVELPLPVEPR